MSSWETMLQSLSEPFEYEFMRKAALTTILIGLTCAVLGAYVVLRQIAFISDAIAHTTLPGIALASVLGWSLFGGAVAAALVTAFLIAWIARNREVREDTAIGISFTSMFAMGIVIINLSPSSYRDLKHILFGNILAVTSTDMTLIAIVSGVVLATLALFHKELELTSYDPTHAQAIGINPNRLRYLLFTLLALTVVTAIQAVGIVLTTALLITPAATAGILTRRFIRMMGIAAIVGVIGGLGGLYVSFYAGFPSGASMVLSCTAIFVVVSVGSRFKAARSTS